MGFDGPLVFGRVTAGYDCTGSTEHHRTGSTEHHRTGSTEHHRTGSIERDYPSLLPRFQPSWRTRVQLVRPGSSDVDELTELWLSLADGQRRFGSHLLSAENRRQIRQSFLEHVVTGGIWGASVDDEWVGFVTYSRERGRFEQDVDPGVVTNLYVDPAYRGRGIGSTLLERAERQLADSGADVVRLEAMSTNTEARKFYEKRDYLPHRITYEKPLSSDENLD